MCREQTGTITVNINITHHRTLLTVTSYHVVLLMRQKE